MSEVETETVEEIPQEIPETLKPDKAPRRTKKATEASQTEATTEEKKEKPKRAASSRGKLGELEAIRQMLNGVWATSATGINMYGMMASMQGREELVKKLEFDADIILKQGPKITDSMIKVCSENEQMRKALMNLATGGVYGELLINLLMLAVPIAANHNAIPAYIGQMYGVPQETKEHNGLTNGTTDYGFTT